MGSMRYDLIFASSESMHDAGAFNRKVGEKIRAKRQERGVSQEALATVLGLKRPSLSNIEKGRQNILLHTIWGIAETLNVNVSELLPDRILSEPKGPADLGALTKGVRAFVDAGIKSPNKSGR